MTAFTLGEAAELVLGRVEARGPACPDTHPQTRQHTSATDRPGAGRVRRGSVEAGSFEAMFFAVPAAGECDRMLRAARDALDAGRRLKRTARTTGRALAGPERALAALTAGAVRVFEELCALARLNHGRVYPSYDHLAEVTALGRATVARALAALEAAGFLHRRRRFVRIDGEGAGPRYAQTSNAYRPTVPGRIARLLRASGAARRRGPAPIPDDQAQRAAEEAGALARMRATMNCRDLARASVDGALGRMLERLGAAIDARPHVAERESHGGSQSHPHLIHTRQSIAVSASSRPRTAYATGPARC